MIVVAAARAAALASFEGSDFSARETRVPSTDTGSPGFAASKRGAAGSASHLPQNLWPAGL